MSNIVVMRQQNSIVTSHVRCIYAIRHFCRCNMQQQMTEQFDKTVPLQTCIQAKCCMHWHFLYSFWLCPALRWWIWQCLLLAKLQCHSCRNDDRPVLFFDYTPECTAGESICAMTMRIASDSTEILNACVPNILKSFFPLFVHYVSGILIRWHHDACAAYTTM